MEYKIEKGVQFPEPKGGMHVRFIKSLNVGDSFIAESKTINTLRGASHKYKLNCKFIGRQTEDGFRIWLKSK